ncbi:hypothetical protein GCM10010420_08160 [Streptomyces glaucosporus]|uniref:Secreted protein n=1 Tax=Streptomyces glaucosporus TaxID=284044 RepID=A0ABN3HTK8_9ACTN
MVFPDSLLAPAVGTGTSRSAALRSSPCVAFRPAGTSPRAAAGTGPRPGATEQEAWVPRPEGDKLPLVRSDAAAAPAGRAHDRRHRGLPRPPTARVAPWDRSDTPLLQAFACKS